MNTRLVGVVLRSDGLQNQITLVTEEAVKLLKMVHVSTCFLVSLLTLVVFVCFKHIEATGAVLTSPGNLNSHLPELMSQFQIIFTSTDCVSSSQLFASLHVTGFKQDSLCLETLKVERCFFTSM